jgi:hypothetical protein
MPYFPKYCSYRWNETGLGAHAASSDVGKRHGRRFARGDGDAVARVEWVHGEPGGQ